MIFLLYLLLGVAAGFLSGLFGIGGGIVVVPVLFYSFSLLGFSESLVMQMALGTSLATIIITSSAAARAHHKRGNLIWPLFWKLTPGLLVGAMLGGVIAHYLSGELLRKGFGCFLILMAMQMWFSFSPKGDQALPKTPTLMGITTITGTLSALFGIGGGSLIVPVLTWCKLPVRQAIGTASATGLAVALTGSLSFLINGLHAEGLPQYSLGYIYLPAFLGIVLASSQSVRLGAHLVSRLDPVKLKRSFAIFLLILAARLIIS